MDFSFDATLEHKMGMREERMRELLGWLDGRVRANGLPDVLLREIEKSVFSVGEKVYLGMRLGFLIQEGEFKRQRGFVVDAKCAEVPRAS